MKLEKINKKWGYEEIIENNELYCGKFLHLKKSHCCSIHYHKIKDETFYVLEGKVKLELFGSTIILKKGDKIRLTPFSLHRFYGIEDSIILEISNTHVESDSYRIKESDNCD